MSNSKPVSCFLLKLTQEVCRPNHENNISLYKCLQSLCHSKVPKREKALSGIVHEFSTNLHHDFATTNFGELELYCQRCIRRGSEMEITLTLQVIGLLAITIGPGELAIQIYDDWLPIISQALYAKSPCIKMLECLAIVTLVAARDFRETQRAMLIIWEFILQDHKSKVWKHDAPLLASAISSWAFLLGTLQPRLICHNYWTRAIPYFLKMLEEEKDEDVTVAILEALALIFDMGCLDKFCCEAKQYNTMKYLREDVAKKIRRSCSGTNVLIPNFLKEKGRGQTLKIYGKDLILRSRANLKQLIFIKQFLGMGFHYHIKNNEYLHKLFQYIPRTNCDPEVQFYESDEVLWSSLDFFEGSIYSPDLIRNAKLGRFTPGYEEADDY